MKWNYRIVRYRDQQAGYGLHEVFYNEAGEATGMIADPVTFTSEEKTDTAARDGIIGALQAALDDARHQPVFEEPEADGWAVMDG